ncbi:helix-turn-helix domain-containing protein [Streptomyces sp. NPDC002742]|uniref:helix-turn-helix domain-containing protein n=1 Tax=Streptomyces sp. NPDC002742 TaxID=3364663 RepID=UPI00367E3DAB
MTDVQARELGPGGAGGQLLGAGGTWSTPARWACVHPDRSSWRGCCRLPQARSTSADRFACLARCRRLPGIPDCLAKAAPEEGGLRSQAPSPGADPGLVVLHAARGHSNARIARATGLHLDTVGRWRGRFSHGGLLALADARRPGRPARSTPVHAAETKALACQLPAETGIPPSRWSCPELAAELTARAITGPAPRPTGLPGPRSGPRQAGEPHLRAGRRAGLPGLPTTSTARRCSAAPRRAPASSRS